MRKLENTAKATPWIRAATLLLSAYARSLPGHGLDLAFRACRKGNREEIGMIVGKLSHIHAAYVTCEAHYEYVREGGGIKSHRAAGCNISPVLAVHQLLQAL